MYVFTLTQITQYMANTARGIRQLAAATAVVRHGHVQSTADQAQADYDAALRPRP
ncbi:hypothetical protein [Streptomyces geranii]|uniref:hypothetical protein n=1 Tax=Streptomyces geranii TaxID=2058923 RepID=UPI001300BDE7|nr:hypothetical protein [Streptomyces geranii]